MPNPLMRWLMSSEKVHLATTDEEREAIYRLRYEVYAVEKGWVGCGEDHARRRLVDAHDSASTARQLYLGSVDDMKGTARLQIYEPGQVPADWARMYALDRFPGIEKLRIAEVGRFAIRKDCRGGLVMPTLICFGFNQLVGPENADLGFCECRPSMVRHYRKIGFRPYNAPMIHDIDGMQVPLVVVPSDHAYLKSVDAIIRSDAARHFGRGKRTPIDTSAFQHLFDDDNQRVAVEERQVLSQLDETFREPDASAASLWAALPPEATDRATKHGFLLDLEPGELLLQEGRAEREGYLILSGQCEITVGGTRVQVIGPGEPIGEMAYFLEEGRRTASARALTKARVLVLDRRFLDELHRDAPDAAYQVLHLLGRSLSRRLAETTQALTRATPKA